MQLTSTLSVLAVAAVCCGGASCKKSGPVGVVAEVARAYGGVDLIEAPIAVKQTGRVRSPRFPGAEGSIIRGFEGPSRLRVEVVFANEAPEVRVLNGKAAWRQSEQVTGASMDAIVLQAARLSLPALLLASAGVVDGGLVERAGRRVRLLTLPLGEGREVDAELDPGTGRIVRSIGRGTGAQPIEFTSTYDDFREVNGRLFAFHERTTAMGQDAAELHFTSVEVFPAFPGEVFGPPGPP